MPESLTNLGIDAAAVAITYTLWNLEQKAKVSCASGGASGELSSFLFAHALIFMDVAAAPSYI